MRKLKVLDLFSGLEGWSGPWKELGHLTYRVELDERFPAEWRDIRNFKKEALPWQPDVILASPPCTWFTVMRIGMNWNKDNTPKTDGARLGIELVNITRRLIKEINPQYFVIENPMGKLRKLDLVSDLERRHVTYCQYGETRMKPTDLWGGFPPSLELKPPCYQGAPCHQSAPRGSRNSTQGLIVSDKALAAKIPKQLSLDILEACIKDIR